MDMPSKFALGFCLIVVVLSAIVYFFALYWPDPKPVLLPASRSNRHVRPKQCAIRASRGPCHPVSRVHVSGYVSFNQGLHNTPHQSNRRSA